MAVVKADAYGHGDAMVAKALSDHGVKLFAVSNIDEAVGLRNAGVDGEILILGYSSPKYANTIYYLNLTQAIVSDEYAKASSDYITKRIGGHRAVAEACLHIMKNFFEPYEPLKKKQNE